MNSFQIISIYKIDYRIFKFAIIFPLFTFVTCQIKSNYTIYLFHWQVVNVKEWSEYAMFKNKHEDGTYNRCGKRIAAMRKQISPKMSQRGLAEELQRRGLDLDKNAIQRIESGERFITDIELAAFAKFFGVTADELLFGGE